MESNGKRYHHDGSDIFPYIKEDGGTTHQDRTLLSSRINNNHTEVVVWGEAGTNGQHAFYQLIHQGTRIVPVDVIFPFITHNPIEKNSHHLLLASNVFAQTEALMKGKDYASAYAELSSVTDDEKRKVLARHKTFPGNRPSNMIIIDKVTPHTLGMLIALYEHKVYVEGVIWDVNSFDQMGVELGKQLSNVIFPILENPAANEGALALKDSSTRNLINLFIEAQKMEKEEKEGSGVVSSGTVNKSASATSGAASVDDDDVSVPLTAQKRKHETIDVGIDTNKQSEEEDQKSPKNRKKRKTGCK